MPTPHAALLQRLSRLRDDCLALELQQAPLLAELEAACTTRSPGPVPGAIASCRNLLHYLAIRREDLRELHTPLAELGLSSLGRIEPHVLANLDAVLGALSGFPTPEPAPLTPPITLTQAGLLIEHRTAALLGPARRSPSADTVRTGPVRIMVTLPTEAARDPVLVRALIEAGMSCARINTAHDGPDAWVRMSEHVRTQASALGAECRILMDLAGPKLRTGPIALGPEVLRVKPERDDLGRVVRPATLLFRADDSSDFAPGEVLVPASWLNALRPGDAIEFFDTRGRRRLLRVHGVGGELGPGRAVTTTDRTVYFGSNTRLRLLNANGRERDAISGRVPGVKQFILARPGDLIRLSLTAAAGKPASGNDPAILTCTLPEAFDHAKPGESVFIDDGRVGAVIESVEDGEILLRVQQASPNGDRIREDKGINLPDTDIAVHGLTPEDIEVLPIAARHADIVGMSFVREASDVAELRTRLIDLGGSHLGTILKIETRRAFENLPNLLLAALQWPSAGVMIARGDLAVEVGYERLGEVQEEILWLCEAAHVPVIWATQVLETMAKTGRPSRAEVTDAAMGERAECVMLNKGPYIVEVVRFLDSLMRRMQEHQSKKRTFLRALGVARRFGTTPAAPDSFPANGTA
ncbi:MAG: pyruvate kinase [Phycisphaerales bacterium]